ncbi:hypothetical protein D910_05080 [Dendroctonus ponderosae]
MSNTVPQLYLYWCHYHWPNLSYFVNIFANFPCLLKMVGGFRSFAEYKSDWHGPNNFLTFGFYKRNYALFPIVTLAFLDCCWMAFCTIKGFQRTDIVLSRNFIKNKHQSELIDLLIHPVNRKFFTIKQTFEPQPELYNLYQQMIKAEQDGD